LLPIKRSDRMEIERVLANFGTEAVLHCRAMAKTRYDNEVAFDIDILSKL
jgi:hypothetical protein